MWANIFWSANTMPLDQGSIDELMAEFGEDPQAETLGTTVFVANASSNPLRPDQRGLMKDVSPEEPRMAFILQLKKLLDAGADVEIISKYRNLILSATCTFEPHSKEDDVGWRAEQLREQSAKDHDRLSISPLQRGFRIWSWKVKQGKKLRKQLTFQEVVDEYGKHVQLASSSEPVKVGFIEAMVHVMNYIMVHPELRELVMSCQKKHKHRSPWNSMYKLDCLQIRSNAATADDGGKAKMTLMIHTVNDYIENDYLALEEITHLSLSGKKNPGGKGLLHLIL